MRREHEKVNTFYFTELILLKTMRNIISAAAAEEMQMQGGRSEPVGTFVSWASGWLLLSTGDVTIHQVGYCRRWCTEARRCDYHSDNEST